MFQIKMKAPNNITGELCEAEEESLFYCLCMLTKWKRSYF